MRSDLSLKNVLRYIVVTFDQKRVADGRQKENIATAKQVVDSGFVCHKRLIGVEVVM